MATARGYRRIEQDFRRRIVAGEWPAGKRLPSIRDLAVSFDVNYTTAHRAIAELQRHGFVSSSGRHGSFVSDGWTHQASAARSAPAEGETPKSVRPLRLAMVVSWTPESSASVYPPVLMIERLLMARVLQEGGTFLPVLHPGTERAAVDAFVASLCNTPIDAVLVPGGIDPGAPDLAGKLAASGCAVVSFSGTMADESTGDTVRVDDEWAFREVTRRLWEFGHRRIGFVGVPKARRDLVWSRTREAAWRSAMNELGASPRSGDALALNADLSAPAGIERFTALVCAHDEIGVTVMQALRGRGRRVPEDVSVTGFDHLMVRPEFRELTTFTWPDERLVAAIQTLVRRRLSDSADEETGDRAEIVLRPVLVARSSWGSCDG